jgi:hypothetical protein
LKALRVLGRAFLLCFGASLAAIVLSLSGWWMVAIFTSVGFGFLGMSLGQGWLAERATSTSVAAFCGLVIVVSASIMSLATVEQRLWPNRVVVSTTERAQGNFLATSFGFQRARPKPELRGDAPVFGRHSSTVDTVTVVPVVDDSWTPQEPILVWAVARRATLQERSRWWGQPIGDGVRISGFYVSDYQNAVADACRRHELRAGRDPLFVEWTPTPQASLVAAWHALGTITVIATLLLFVLLLLAKLFGPRRRTLPNDARLRNPSA